MSQITLEFNNSDDESFVLSLLQRLGVSFSMTKKETSEIKNINLPKELTEKITEPDNLSIFRKYRGRYQGDFNREECYDR